MMQVLRGILQPCLNVREFNIATQSLADRRKIKY